MANKRSKVTSHQKQTNNASEKPLDSIETLIAMPRSEFSENQLARNSIAQSELLMTSPKPRHERMKQRPNRGVVPRLMAPNHLRQRLRPQVPQATQVLHHLRQLVLRRLSLHQSRCQRQQNHPGHLLLTNHNQHLSTRRNALIDLTYFLLVTDDEWVLYGVLHLHL